MRRVGGDLTEEQAQRFSAYLYTEGIETVVESAAGGTFDVWARDEDALSRARQEYGAFVKDADNPRYRVDRKAEAMRKTKEKENRERNKLQKQFQPRRASAAGSLAAPARATMGIIAACILLSLLTSFGNVTRADLVRNEGQLPMSKQIFNNLTLLPEQGVPEGAGPMWAVSRGQVWRLVTPLFLHGSVMHLLFNCLFIFSFGRIVEILYGPAFLLGLFLIGGIVGMFAQAYGPLALGASPHVIGASGGALALFSFLWLRPNFEPTLPFRMSPLNVVFILGFVFISMLPSSVFPNVANLAHLGGLIFGAVAAVGAIDFLRR